MQKAFKYRLYPNSEQCSELISIFKFCRFLYNSALEERINYYKRFNKTVSYNTQASYLKDIKEDFGCETSKIYSQSLQQTLKQLDSAFTEFFRRVKSKSSKAGFPRFKNADRFKSICFPQIKPDASAGGIKLLDNKLQVFGITGNIKIVYHRPIEGIAKQARIVKQNDQFYLVITCDNVPNKPLLKTGKTTAIDLGLISFATLDDGTKFHHPKPYKTAKEKLAYQQRKLALKQKGSNNRDKQKKLIGKTYQKITNIREDFQHKLANNLLKKYDKIIVEDLNIKNMLEAKGFEVNKSNIQDASWGKFIEKLTYKAESADKLIVKVPSRNTSKTCSRCGIIDKELKLINREFRCKACGFAVDRDVNAAKNILTLGTSDVILTKSQ